MTPEGRRAARERRFVPARGRGTTATTPQAIRARPVWLFDLDNTLHDASHAIFGAIDSRMTDYVERALGLDRSEANRLRTQYWRRYGATLIGLVRHHGIDPHHFLRETHDFEVADLLRAERGLARLLARLPGRKLLLTNAPLAYAGDVLRELSLHRQFSGHYTIERMRLHGTFRPKPSRLMLRAMLARERIRPAAAILVEDTLANLKAARALGLRTVLITRHGRVKSRGGTSGIVGLRIASLHQLARRVPR